MDSPTRNPALKFVVPLKAATVELGGTLTLTCELNRASGDVVWRHDGREIKPGGRHCVRADGAKRVLAVTGATKEDEGDYDCECRNDKTSARLNNVAATEGKDAVFKCAVSPADADVKWFHNNVPVTAGPRYRIERGGGSHSLTIASVAQKDAGEISVDAEGKSCKASLQVQHEPVTFKKKLENLTAEEQSEVKLEVELSKPSEEVRWMKNSVVLQPAGNMEIRVDGAKQTLVFKSVTCADRGVYSCETLDDKTQTKLNVEKTQVHETETVTFEVELSQADVEGSWTRDGAKLKSGANCRITALGKKQALTLSNLKREDAGTISFQAEGVHSSGKLIITGKSCFPVGRRMGGSVQHPTCVLVSTEPPAMISKPLVDIAAPEKEKVTFECELSRTNADVKWRVSSQEIVMRLFFNMICLNNDHLQTVLTFLIPGRTHVLLFKTVAPEDTGEIKFTADKASSAARLKVKELPVKFVKRLRDKIAMYKHRGHLECQVSRASAKVKWYKNKTELKHGKKYEIRSEDVYRKLLINDVDSGDEDTYTCDGTDDRTSCKLLVEGNIVEGHKHWLWASVEVTEPFAAVFEVEISMELVKPPTWTLNGVAVQESADVEMEKEGAMHRLTRSSITCVIIRGLITCCPSHSERPLEVAEPMKDVKAKEKSSAILTCKFSASPKEVKWFKGQGPLAASDKYNIKQDATRAQLTIQRLTEEDSGEYRCRIVFTLKPSRLFCPARDIKITKHLADTEVDEDSDAAFTCEINYADEEVQWLLSDKVLFTNEVNVRTGMHNTLMVTFLHHLETWLTQNTIHITHCQTFVFSRFPFKEKRAVFLKSLDDVIGEEKGMITLACEASKPRVSPTWRKESQVLKAGSKYELLHTGKSLGLIIKDVTNEDAGEYSCDLGTEVSKAKVTVRAAASSVSQGLQSVSAVRGEDAVFTCEVTQCSSTVKWAKESKTIKKSQKYDISQEDKVMKLIVLNVAAQDSGEYSCEVVGGATTRATLDVREPTHVFTKALMDSRAEEGSAVVLQCEIAQCPSTVIWLKGPAELKAGGRYEMSQKDGILTLTIKHLEEKDTDIYTCDVGTAKSVAKVTVNEKLQSQEAEEGASVTLCCELSKPGVPVEWKKGTQILKSGQKYQMKQKASVNQLLIDQVEPEDSGDYSCVCGDQKTSASLKIKARPVTFKQKLEGQEAEEGASVTLCCELSKPGVPVEWKKGTQILKSGQKYQMKQKASVNQLLIDQVEPEDSGDYSCVCGDQKTSASLKIKARPVTFKQKLEGQEAEEGASVTLCCELSKHGVPVEWKKGTQILKSGQKYQMKQKASVNQLLIDQVEPEDSGDYSCVCGDQKTSLVQLQHVTRPVTFKQKLEGQEAEEGASVTLCCELSKPGVPVEWKKGTQILKSGQKYQMKQKASVNQLLIDQVEPEDSGDYSCVCGDQKTSASLKIKGRRRIYRDSTSGKCAIHCIGRLLVCSYLDISSCKIATYNARPVTFKQKLEGQEAEEGASVTLCCELSKPGVPVEWKKGTQILKSGQKYQMKQKASMNQLLIDQLEPEDSGDYSCVCGDQKTSASLKIKVLPVVVVRDLESREAEEGHAVTLRCELSKPGLPVEWRRGTRVLSRGEKYQMKQIGSSYELQISDLTPGDTGSYTCRSEDALCSASLVVNAAPVIFTKELESQTADEGDSVTLHCELSKAGVPLEWRKGELGLCPCAKYDIRQAGHLASLVIHDVDPEDRHLNCCRLTLTTVNNERYMYLNRDKAYFLWHFWSFFFIDCDQFRTICHLRKKTHFHIRYNDLDFSSCMCVAGYTLGVGCTRPVLFKTQLQNLERREGESASLRCETTTPGAGVVWRLGDRPLASSGKYHLKQEGTVVELAIYKLQGADSGEYSCDTGDQRTSAVLTVQGRSLSYLSLFLLESRLFHALPTSSLPTLEHDIQEAREGDAATLSCETSSPDCQVIWLKGSTVLTHGEKYNTEQRASTHILVVHKLNVQDGGEYTCDTGGRKSTATLTVKEHVRLVRELCDLTVATGQDAVFEVELSHSGVTHGEWWLADNLLQNNDLNQMSVRGAVHRLVLKMVTTDESGDVAFVVGEEKTVACLLVEEKPKGKGDDAVTPHIHLHRPTNRLCLGKWKYAGSIINIITFYLSNVTVLMSNGAFRQLCIHNLVPEDSGTYTCDTGDAQCGVTLTVEGKERCHLFRPVWHQRCVSSASVYRDACAPVFFRKELKNLDALEGEEVTLRCEPSKPGVRVEWRKGGMVLQPGKKCEMRQEGCVQELVLRNLEPEDSGYYTCDAGDQLTTASLAVQDAVRHIQCVLDTILSLQHSSGVIKLTCHFGHILHLFVYLMAPPPPTPTPPTSDPTVEVVSEMEDLRVLKNQPAEFICQYSRPVTAQWKKDGRPLQPDGRRVLVEQDWNVARLYISHASAEDAGAYACEAEGTRVVASLYVEGELPPATWRPQPPERLLCSLTVSDSCTVTFKAGAASTSAQLSVKGESSERTRVAFVALFSAVIMHSNLFHCLRLAAGCCEASGGQGGRSGREG
uniref:Ig-like domain-containing protein n=1 Tax=Cyclopterus lumpus TaxID=8103 RepID=A0A8C3B0J3_CYCLU